MAQVFQSRRVRMSAPVISLRAPIVKFLVAKANDVRYSDREVGTL